jgi:hypothetical protein
VADFPITPSSDVEGDDLFPQDEDDQRKVTLWAERLFEDAKRAKDGHQDRWDQFYTMYRSYVAKGKKGDWRSRVWMPIAFFVIETIAPRLVAQLPKFTVLPVGPEDSDPAETMEELLAWAADQSQLYIELVKALKSALMYGTGILKTSYFEQERFQIVHEPVMQETFSEMWSGELDMENQPIMTRVPMGVQPTGETMVTRTPYISYAGPKAEAVDIDNFFVDPIADSIENARYVIHRVFRDKDHLEKMFEQGVYKKPPEDVWTSFLTEHATLRRQSLIDLGPGSTPSEYDDQLVTLLEIWTDGVVTTCAGGDVNAAVLLRAERNPYAHGEKPFVRIVDHLVPHEFWGIGELEPLEGLQNVLNELWNSRIDNVKLVLNTMFLAVMDYVEDPSDLQVRPAGVVRIREGVPLNQAVQPLNLGEVTSSSYTEAAEIERLTEKVSGVSPLQTGQDSPAYNRTATGAALIQESGNTRFAHKIHIAELTGFKALARQYASILQQFSDPETVVRILGPLGQMSWQAITPESIGGRFDFDVESESSTQTESIRREQTLSLFQYFAADPYSKPLRIREDVLKSFGRKNIHEYLLTEEELQQLMMMQQQQQQQEQANAQGSVPPQ